MYAIVEIAGQQFKVEKGENIFVHRLSNEEGAEVTFDNVLLIDNEGKISIGEPIVEGAFVEGKVLSHVKGDKVIVFKKKRRKGYQKSNGHRQLFSSVEIISVNESGKPKAAKAVVKEAQVEEKPAEIKLEVKKAAEGKVEAKTIEANKPEAEKPAAKKTTEEKTEIKKPAATKTAAKKTAAKKPATKKPSVKKAAEGKTEVKKTVAKKTAAKKADDKSSEKDSK